MVGSVCSEIRKLYRPVQIERDGTCSLEKVVINSPSALNSRTKLHDALVVTPLNFVLPGLGYPLPRRTFRFVRDELVGGVLLKSSCRITSCLASGTSTN